MLRPLAVLAFLAGPAFAQDITALPAEQLDWQATPEGVAFAALQGDRFAEAYMAMVELPGGLISPPHIKTADMFGVMISGQMTHVLAGADPMSGDVLETGAYYHIPAGIPHISSCISDEPCVAFLYQDGAFDFLPVTQ